MDGLQELPAPFQTAFEVTKAKADQEYSNRGRRFPHSPAFGRLPTHLPILIQSVFFGYCDQARKACAAGWPLGKTRSATERAWPAICDYYVVRENGAVADAQKSDYQSLLWKTMDDDPRWPHHLSELVRLGEAMPSIPIKGARKKQPAKLKRVSAPDGRRTPEPRFPERASWLAKCLHERGWNKYDLADQGGPDHKTTQKVLDGKKVREDVLVRIASALSKKLPHVKMENVPQN